MKMNDVLKRAYSVTILSSIVCFLFGLLIFLNTTIALSSIAVIIGIILIILGCALAVEYFRDGALRFVYGYSLLYAILDVIAGIVMIKEPSLIYVIISIFVAVNLVVEFIAKVQIGMVFKDSKVDGWLMQFILAVVILLCAIIILVNPMDSAQIITKVVSAIIMVSSILNVVDCMIIKERAVKVKKSIKDFFE